MAVENCSTKNVETIRESTGDAYGDKYDIGHAAAPLVMLGEHIGTPGPSTPIWSGKLSVPASATWAADLAARRELGIRA